MLNSLQNLAWWHWWILAAALAALETFVPGVIAIWFAAAALVVGSLLLVALVLWRRFRPEGGEPTDQPLLNQRGSHYIGQVFTLVEPIVSGVGKVKVGDSVWMARGGDAPLGARVKVVGVNGTVLQVEPA
jgi:hypothetical protein